jgi:hypothetical protein
MKQWFRARTHSVDAATDIAPDGTTKNESAGSPTRRSRRGVFGWMKGAGLGLAAIAGAGVRLKDSSQTAYADTLGNFSSSDGSTPAVTVTGTSGFSRGVRKHRLGPGYHEHGRAWRG